MLDILTHENVGDLAKPPHALDRRPDHDDPGKRPHLARRPDHRRGRRRHLSRQRARRRTRWRSSYVEEPPSATFDSAGVETEPHQPRCGPRPAEKRRRGRLRRRTGQGRGPLRRRRRNTTIRSSSSPPPASGTGRSSTIYEPSQFMWGSKAAVAQAARHRPGECPRDLALCRRRVRLQGRPDVAHGLDRASPRSVSAVRSSWWPTRDQGFTIATYRAETRQHVRLGADAGRQADVVISTRAGRSPPVPPATTWPAWRRRRGCTPAPTSPRR